MHLVRRGMDGRLAQVDPQIGDASARRLARFAALAFFEVGAAFRVTPKAVERRGAKLVGVGVSWFQLYGGVAILQGLGPFAFVQIAAGAIEVSRKIPGVGLDRRRVVNDRFAIAMPGGEPVAGVVVALRLADRASGGRRGAVGREGKEGQEKEKQFAARSHGKHGGITVVGRG